MKRILVYSHDTYGLGNIRRMLAICEHLVESDPQLSILLITGSPVIHNLRLPPQLDYIKLPCLTRTEYEGYEVKYLGTGVEETIRLRSDLILSAVANYKPDLFLIDKKPYGVKNELLVALNYARLHLPGAKWALVLRDILDSPERTIDVWRKHGYSEAIEHFYERVFVMGTEEIFDLCGEYRLPKPAANKVRYCGYLKRAAVAKSCGEVRAQYGIESEKQLVVVTPGGGQDGFHILSTYLDTLALLPQSAPFHSVLVSGPEMPAVQKEYLQRVAARDARVDLLEFTNDSLSLMNAADLVISMSGYNTICELLSLRKRTIVVPRARPAQEQLIRAQRMQDRNLFPFIHPDELSPMRLKAALLESLRGGEEKPEAFARALSRVEMGALPIIGNEVAQMLSAPENVPAAKKRTLIGKIVYA